MNPEISFFASILPVAGRCEPLRTSFNISLKDSLIYLIEACKEALDPILFNQINDKLDILNCELKFSGLLSAIHLKLYNEVKKKNIAGILEVCEQFLSRDFHIYDIKYLNLSDENDFYRPVIEKICSLEVERENEYDFLSKENFEFSKTMVQKGFELLKNYFKEFYTESTELIGEVLLLNAKGIQAGTSTDLFGMIHKNHAYRPDKITDILDFIIHEQSHLYLHLLNTKDILVENPMERYESPLRATLRPIIGIYHATFVLSRIIYVLSNAHKRNLLPSSEINYCHDLVEHYETRFFVGVNVLKKHAKMTSLGREIITSSKELLESTS